MTDRVTDLLNAWSAKHATGEQQARVKVLVAYVQTYRGAVEFVSQMLDVDFVAAVSFIRPFDQNFHDLMQSVDALVREVQAQQHADADGAMETAATTVKAFEGVGIIAVLIALMAAGNMGWAAVRSLHLTRQNNVLTRMSQVDALTGLGNRRCFDETLASAWADCMVRQERLTLVMFDIDHFKQYNDSQGHPAGDACLQRVAAAVRACSRDDDQAMRYGGEEFAIVLPGVATAAGLALAERVRAAVEGCAIPHPAAGPPGIVTISMGVGSLVPTLAAGPAILVAHADTALYAARRGGRNRVCDAGPMTDPAIPPPSSELTVAG